MKCISTESAAGCCHPGGRLAPRIARAAASKRSSARTQVLSGSRPAVDLQHANGTPLQTLPQDMATFSHTVPFKSANAPPATIKSPAPTGLPASFELPKPSATNSPQVVYAPGKSPQAVAASLQALLQFQRAAIAVKVEPALHKAVAELLPEVEYNPTSRLLTARAADPFGLPKIPKLPGSVAVVAAVASSLPLVEECRALAEHLGCYAFKLTNLDISDMEALLASAEAIKAADVVIVVSGGDSALPAALAAIVDAPIVAVPVARGPATGLAPSEGFMASCAPGVTVVSPESGYAAAVTAARMLRMASRLHHKRTVAVAAATGAQ